MSERLSLYGKVILLASVELCAAAAPARYAVRKVANPEFRPSQIFFRFEDISSPPFDGLCRRFAFGDAVKGVGGEFERILRLRHWIFVTLRIDPSRPNPPPDAISILAQGPSGGPLECTHAMIAQNAVMNAMGYVTRCLQPGPGREENIYLSAIRSFLHVIAMT